VTSYKDFAKNTVWRTTQYSATATVVATCAPGSTTGKSSACIEGADADNKCPANSPVIPPSVSTAPCSQKGVLASADLMWGSTYVADCAYLTKTAAGAVAAGKACNKIGPGFFYLFAAHGCIAACYVVIACITLHGYKVWANPEENFVGEELFEEGGTSLGLGGLQPPGTAPEVGAQDKAFI